MDVLDKLELKMHRETLKYAIQRHPTFFCEITGKGLDVRRSVLLTFTRPDGASVTKVYDASVLDLRADVLAEMVADGWTVEVVDGRKLQSRSDRVAASGVYVLQAAPAVTVDPNQGELF